MAEIRLICPGCAAEYRVPDSAIPPEGREVECGGCGKVWHATARLALADFQARAATEPSSDLPRLNRPLPDSVLDILRDEVEHERRARAAEDVGTAPQDPKAAPPPAPDPEWPATTITRHFDPKPPETPQPARREPEPARPAPVQSAKLRPAVVVAERPSPDTARQAAVPQPRQTRRPSGYGAGFGLALVLAGGVAVLYLLVPTLAGQGDFGEGLMDLRAALDQARLWLQDRAAALIR
ncbi:zinc-ribbon domain-containing protein [Paracoccus sp. WLY502]|uniref:zinc-ribbon domain-containing protein n=1 Tax=Paracoccus yibinensis TaxID=3068891 RepID=UPI002796C4E1|nr:zinc-ribbon domain-containing protein [Paracoccus sp. WLY502]MDQ1900782.1 zinc-ribbon domain-containing protein [Paracoccus sp. WLY502]